MTTPYVPLIDSAQQYANLRDQQQQYQMRLVAFQQQQQDRQRQQAAMQAAGNALPQLLPGGQVAAQPQGQMPSPPQAPPPGQSSQPQQAGPQPGQSPSPTMGAQSGPPPGAQSGPPPGQPQGQVPPPPVQQAYQAGMQAGAKQVMQQLQQRQAPPQGQPQGGMPLPGQGTPPGAQQVNKPPLPPFQGMPTSPPQQAQAPQGIPAPPGGGGGQPQAAPPVDDQMEGGFSLQRIVQSGQKQGLAGSDLMDYVKTFEPYMNAQQKAYSDKVQKQIEMKKLDAEIQAHQIAATNQQLSLAERMKHDDALEKLASRRADISQEGVDIRANKGATGAGGPALPPAADTKPDASGNIPAPPPVAGYSSQAIQALGDDYAVRGPSALSGFGNKNLPAAARTAIVNYAAAKNAANGGNFASNKIQFGADTAGARVNSQQAAKTDAAANALTSPGGIGDQFQTSIDALNRTGIPIANEAQMHALRLTNDPRISTYDTAMNGVVSEAAQILGRGQITVNSMEEARKVVQGWHTSEQAKAGLAQIKREAATTIKASSEEVAKSARTKAGQPGVQAGAIPQGWTVTEH